MKGKKFGLLLTFVLLTSLLLAACANSGTTNNGLGTPGALETEIPVTGDEDLATEDPLLEPEEPMITDEPLAETPLATEVIDEEPVVETPLATEAPIMEETEVVETPVDDTGAVAEGDEFECNPNRLSNLLDYEIVTSDGALIGDVNAIVVLRGGNTVYDVDESIFMGEVELTEEEAQALTVPMPNSAPAPVIGYVVADIDDASLETLGLAEDGDLLLPFSAFQPMAAEVETDVVDTDDADDTDVAEIDTCAMTLNLVGTDLQTAPVFEDDNWDFTVEGWDAEVVTWSEGLGFAAPTLGTDVDSRYVVFEDGAFDSVDIDVENLADEDLGEIEDFIVNSQDGTFTHAVLVTNSFLGLGGRSIPVPVSHMMWVDEDDDLEDQGEILIPVEEGSFDDAPEFDLDLVDFNTETWDDEWEAFWTGLTVQ